MVQSIGSVIRQLEWKTEIRVEPKNMKLESYWLLKYQPALRNSQTQPCSLHPLNVRPEIQMTKDGESLVKIGNDLCLKVF